MHSQQYKFSCQLTEILCILIPCLLLVHMPLLSNSVARLPKECFKIVTQFYCRSVMELFCLDFVHHQLQYARSLIWYGYILSSIYCHLSHNEESNYFSHQSELCCVCCSVPCYQVQCYNISVHCRITYFHFSTAFLIFIAFFRFEMCLVIMFGSMFLIYLLDVE